MAVKTLEEEKKLLENQTAQQQNTGYQSKWKDSIDNYAEQLANRKPFQYNVNEDALYQQYANQYAQQGRMAMMDTIGQATALTGGYDNSYANSVGQQAYQGYLNQLNDVVPQLYSMALDQYINEGNNMRDQMSMMLQRDEIDYGRYMDDKAAQDDEYNKLVALMTNYGYNPTEDEMIAAGMTEAQKNAILGINPNATAKSRSGGPPKLPPDDGEGNDNDVYGHLTYADIVEASSEKAAEGQSRSDILDYIQTAADLGYINAGQLQTLKNRYGASMQ